MANSYKDIIITPNRANTADPKIEFRGANTTVNTSITLQTYPISNGMLSFEGSAGQLFSITNDLSGSLFSVNDVSGIPSFEVLANGYVMIAPMGGSVVIGNTVFGNTSTSTTGRLVVTSSQTPQIEAINPGTGNAYIASQRATAAAGEVGYLYETGSTVNWYNYLPTNSGALTWYSAGAERMSLSNGGILIVSGDARIPIVYDSNDTNYYSNPAGTSNLNDLILQGGIAATANTANYYDAALEVRERGFAGAQTDTWSIAPRIGFHWSGRVASQIAMNSSGQISILNNPGNDYESLRSGNFYAPIFYDSNDTAYYCNPNGTSKLATIEANAGARIVVQNGVDGGNTRGLSMWTDGDNNWAIYMGQSGASKSFSGGTAATSLLNATAHHIRFRVANNDNQGFLWENGAESALMSLSGSSGNLAVKGNTRSTIFYDIDNTSYYVDSFSTSNMYRINSDGMSGNQFLVGTTNYADVSSGSTWYGIGRNTSDLLGLGGNTVQVAGYYGLRMRTSSATLDMYASYTQASGSLRAPIFYDTDNTAYYIDAASTSVVNAVNFAGGTKVDTAGDVYARRSSGSTGVYYFVDGGNKYLYWNGSDYVFGSQGNVLVGTSFRAPIFYDSNDTNYYIDPNSSSVAYNFTANYFGQRAHGEPRNNLGDPTVTEMALFQEQFNNKTEFYPANNVIFETSTDGSTWSAYSVTDSQKKSFVGGDNSANISIPYNTAYFRVRFVNNGNYVFLNQLYSWWSSNGHQTKVHIYYKLYNSTTWVQHTSSNTLVSSWPGHLWLPFPTIAYNPSNASQADEIAIVFIPTWNATYSANPISLYKMQIWGGYPAGKRNIYSVDNDRNATFPVSARAPIFHDSDNTSYYLDPNSSSVLNLLTVSATNDVQLTLSGGGTSWAGLYWVDPDGADTIYYRGSTSTFAIGGGGSVVANKKLHINGGTTIGSGLAATSVATNGLLVQTDVRAPLFYDSDNTAYYIDAASTSIVNVMRSTNFENVAADGNGLRFWTSDDYKIYMSAASNATWGGRVSGETTSDYNMYFRMSNGTNRGFVFRNGTTNVAGIDANGRIYSNDGRLYLRNATANFIVATAGGVNSTVYVETGGFYVRDYAGINTRLTINSSGNIIAGVDMRSPIFYDSDNTAYYVDATSTSNLNNITANTVTIGLPNVGGTTPVKTFSVVTNSQGANNATYELCRISRDVVNWSTNVLEITVYNLYYRGGMSRWVISYNQVDAGTVELMAEAGTIPHKLYLGNEVTVAGNIRYRPVLIDLPQYTIANIEMKYKYSEVASISSSGQLQFVGTYTTNASATGTASTTTAIIANNSIYWNGIALPAAGTSFGNPNTIGRSDSNGYTFFNYINSNTGNSENPTVSQIIVTNGSDNYYRKASLAHLKSSLGTIDTANNATYAYGKQESQLSVARLTNLTSTTTTNAGTDNSESCISYLSGISLFGQSDGALYSHVYSSSWKHNIYGDYRTGQLAIRGKNNGTWQAWRTVLDSSNYNDYAPTKTGTGASGTWSINVTGSAGSAGSATTATTATYLNSAASSSTKDDITTRTNSGFWESSTGTTAEGWPLNNGSWQHLLASTHSNGSNYYSMQLAADFYTNSLFYRSTNGSGTTAWNRVALYNNAYSDNLRATVFYDNDNTAFYFDGAGTTNINTLSGNGKTVLSTGDTYLRINENMAFTSGTWFGGTMITSTAYYAGGNGGTTNSRVHINGGTYNGTRVLFLDGSDGSISAAGNITAYSSDKRLKTNVKPIENALQKVMTIGGYTFDWDDKVDELGFIPDTRTNDAGVLAQEIQAVLPQAVAPAPFDWQWDEEQEKNASKSGENYLTVRYERIVPLLIEAIKEQQAYINRLEEKIDSIVQKLEDK